MSGHRWQAHIQQDESKTKVFGLFYYVFLGGGVGWGVEGPFNMHEDILVSEASHIIYTIMWQSS